MSATERIVAVVRHGKAERDSPTGQDRDRALTDRGVRQARWLGERLLEAGLDGSPVLTSPAVRTRQTASLIAEILGVEPEESPDLFLDATAGDVVELIASCGGAQRLVLVGHNPTVSVVSSVLVGGIGAHPVEMRTGEASVCRFAGAAEPGRGVPVCRLRLDER